MSFDWQQSTKERYFQKVEEMTLAAGLERFLVVDRSKFSIIKDKVKVYFVKVKRKGNVRRWNEAKRSIGGIKEQKEKNARGRTEKSIFINGYIVLDMDKQDR